MTAAPRPAPVATATLGQRLVAGAVMATSALLSRLPAAPLARLFDALGALHYLVDRPRRELAGANLRRVCAHLVAQGTASPRAAAAASDDRTLARMTRDVFRHHARYYLEVLRASVLGDEAVAGALVIADTAVAEEAFAHVAGGRGVVWIGLHFGSMELPAAFVTRHVGGTIFTPMERMTNPALQAWLERQRGPRIGLRTVDLHGAARPLIAALGRGDGVAIVADRDLTGTGLTMPFFGAPARLPAGPAVLVLKTGAPCYLVTVQRIGWKDYVTRLERLPEPPPGRFRERVEAFVAHQARAFERAIAEAPEQWWSVMFPIWPEPAAVTP